MLSGATIEVSSTPLPRPVSYPPGAAGSVGGGGGGGAAPVGRVLTVSSSDADDMRLNGWKQQQQHQQKQQQFDAVAAEKKDKKPVFVCHAQGPVGMKGSCAPVGPPEGDSSSGAGWGDDATVTAAAAASAPATPAAAERSWRASYASSLYCLLPAWLLRFRRTGYSPLRDNTCTAAASASSSAAASCSQSNAPAAAGGGGGGAVAGGDATSFGDSPFSTVCLHCHKAVVTTVAFKISCIGICLCLLSPLLLGWPGLCLSPFLYIALKDAVHTCPQCRNLIHRQSRVSVPLCGLRDEVVTVKCGSCAVVLSRRYLVLFTALLLLIVLFYVLRVGLLGSSLDVIPKGPPTPLSWQQFYEQCGQRSQLGNSLKAGAKFRDSFAGKTVQWKGLVKQVKEGFFSSNVLFLVMTPTITGSGGSQGGGNNASAEGGDASDSKSSGSDPEADQSSSSRADDRISRSSSDGEEEDSRDADAKAGDAAHDSGATGKRTAGSSSASDNPEEEDLEEEAKALQGDGADLALAFNGRELITKIEKLEPGDRIRFEATLVALGRRGKPSLGRLWDVALVEKREERQARLEEWRTKKSERQHLLKRLLLPIIGSPFSDFGFDPFSSFFSSSGSFGGGSGVMVIRRQIIAPAGSFSVISSSSGGDDTPSPLEGRMGISLSGLRTEDHEVEEEKLHTGSGDTGHGTSEDLFARLGLGKHKIGGADDDEDKYGSGHTSAGGSFVVHLDEDSDDDQEEPKASAGEHRVPLWLKRAAEEDEEVDWHEPRVEPIGGQGLYVPFKDEGEEPPHPYDEAYSPEEPRGAGASTSSPTAAAAATKHEEANQHGRVPVSADTQADEGETGGDPTLAALKAAVEMQRQRRAQEEEEARQRKQTQRGTQQETPHEQQQQQQPQDTKQEPGSWQQQATGESPQAGEVPRRQASRSQSPPWTQNGKATDAVASKIPAEANAERPAPPAAPPAPSRPSHWGRAGGAGTQQQPQHQQQQDQQQQQQPPQRQHQQQREQQSTAQADASAAGGGVASLRHEGETINALPHEAPVDAAAEEAGNA